jgi:hypothetical protein
MVANNCQKSSYTQGSKGFKQLPETKPAPSTFFRKGLIPGKEIIAS